MALKNLLSLGFLLARAASAQRSQSAWGQCAGSSYAGPTACPKAYVCSFGNPWYSQCVPGNADEDLPGVPDQPLSTGTMPTIITVPGSQPTIVTTYITFLTPSPTAGVSTVVIGGSTYTLVPDPTYSDDQAPRAKRTATPTTLAKDQYWIRAVEAPNFHKYLQTTPANTAGAAILASSKTAGQFNIVDGQLVAATGGSPLYMNVEKPADFTQRTLATSFNSTKNTFGTFAFSGDAVTWTAPEVKRQNLAAWLVCKNSALFINTGAYGYQTPSGCVDETIHYYNGATAND